MQGRMTGGAPRARARSRAVSLVIAAAAVPALVAGQAVVAWRRRGRASRPERGARRR